MEDDPEMSLNITSQGFLENLVLEKYWSFIFTKLQVLKK